MLQIEKENKHFKKCKNKELSKLVSLNCILSVLSYLNAFIVLEYSSNQVCTNTNTFFYILFTISSWFIVLSWIMAPFLFNPLDFDWLKKAYDWWFNELDMVQEGVLNKSDQSWDVWGNGENYHLQTIEIWVMVVEIILDIYFFLFPVWHYLYVGYCWRKWKYTCVPSFLDLCGC